MFGLLYCGVNKMYVSFVEGHEFAKYNGCSILHSMHNSVINYLYQIMIIEQHMEQSGDSVAIVQASEMHDLNEFSDQECMHQRIKELLKTAIQSIEGERAEEAIQVLEKIERIIEYMAKLNKPFDKKLKVLCYYNLACIYQQQWVLDKCSTYLAKCLGSMEVVCSQQGNSSLKRCTILVQTVLQYCAILSQAGDHIRALETAKLGVPLLKQIFNRSLQLCEAGTQANKNSMNSHEKILFSEQVLKTAMDYLYELVNLPSFSEMVDKQTEQFQQTREKIYYWKNNPQNNEKLIRKELGAFTAKDENVQQRNLLGLQNSDNWIQTYNIGTIMHMKPLVFQDYSQQDNFMFQISKRKLLQKIMLSSVSYFSLATELRFIEIDRLKHTSQAYGNSVDKYVQSEEYKTSEVFHLKAIEVICKFIKQNSVYVNHLVNSYHKHYRQNLLVIKQEASIIQYSFITQSKGKKNGGSQQKIEDQITSARNQFMAGANSHQTPHPTKKELPEPGFKKNKQPHAVINMKVLKVKEDLMKTQAHEQSSRLKAAEQSNSRTKSSNKHDVSGKFKNHSASRKIQTKLLTKEDMYIPKAKSKSKSKAEFKRGEKQKLKRTLRINKTDKNILIEGDVADEQYNSLTSKNMEFLSKTTKTTQGSSMTKKIFKKQKGNIPKAQSMQQLQHVNISGPFKK